MLNRLFKTTSVLNKCHISFSSGSEVWEESRMKPISGKKKEKVSLVCIVSNSSYTRNNPTPTHPTPGIEPGGRIEVCD